MSDDYSYLEVIFKAATDKAILVEYEGEDGWLPKSKIEDFDEDGTEKGDVITIQVESWILKKRGWD